MAYVFMMTMECESAAEAQSLAACFSFEMSLPSGPATSTAGFARRADRSWCVLATAEPLPENGGLRVKDARRLAEAAEAWYERLRSAPPFRTAKVGIDEECVTIEELQRYRSSRSFEDGLVLSDETWRSLGRPEGFEKFREGALWRPYRGEEP